MRNKLLFTAALFCVEVTPFGHVFTSARAADAFNDQNVTFNEVSVLPSQGNLNTGSSVYRVKGDGTDTNQVFSGSIFGNSDTAATLEKAGGVDINTGGTVNDVQQVQPNNVTFTGQNVYNGYTFVRGNGSLTLTGNGDNLGGIISGGETEVGLAANDSATLTVDKNGILLLRGQTDASGQVLRPYGQLVVGNGDATYGASPAKQENRLNVQNGGQVEVQSLLVGNYKEGNGSVRVEGTGSGLAVNAGGMSVGVDGTGALSVAQGGKAVVNGDVNLGSKSGAQGSVTVDGSGSSLTVNNGQGGTSTTVVADGGQANMNIQNGGTFTTGGNVIIGNQAGSIGSVVVGNGQDGNADQSRLSLLGSGSTGNLTVGNQGVGHLNIQQGGNVAAYGVSVGGQDTDDHLASNSSLSVGSASGGTSQAGGRLEIGQGGLTVGAGAGTHPLYSVGVTSGGIINDAGTVNIKSDGQLKVGGEDQSNANVSTGTLIVGDSNGNSGITSSAAQVDKSVSTNNSGLFVYGNGIIKNRQGSDLHVDSNVYLVDGQPSGEAVRHGTFDTNQQSTYLRGGVVGTGGLNATGGGTLYLANHDNGYTGETVVSGKDTTLALASGYGEESASSNTSSSGIRVENGARLTGNTTDDGAAAVTTVDGGGTVEANWNQSVGTLNIGSVGHQGTALTMNGGPNNQSVLSVGVGSSPLAANSYITLNNATGYSRGNGVIDTVGRSLTGSYHQLNSGLIHVNGDAQLNSATLNLVRNDGGSIHVGDGYRILTTTGTVSANHDNALTGNLPDTLFLTPYLVFENQAVDVIYSRNASTTFSSVAGNGNQREVGRVLDALPDSNVVVRAISGVNSAGEARRALTNLSGDIHASARTALIQDSYLLEQAVLDRLADAGCDDDDNVFTRGHYDLHTRRKESRCYKDHAIMWGQAYGSLGHNGGAGNATLLHHETAGFVIGVDTPVDDRWRLGGMIAYGHSMFNANGASDSSGNSNNISLGAYAGSHWGRFNLRLGAFYTWNLMNMRRHVQVVDFGGRQTSSYRNGTARAFTELSYKFDFNKLQFEPFIEGAYVNQYAGRFHEHGVAALYSQSRDRSVGFTTFGFRVARRFQVGDVWLRAHAMAAYRRTYGSLGSNRTERFMDGGNDMNVNGVLLARDAAVVKAGVAAKVSDRVDLDLSYTGQYGEHAMDSGATGSVKVSF
ncbi:autotransporter domain-containing protein [Bombella sp. TMW 2.2559]|uniref:Autotransporter domain-containing protein n=1 Tax=Bombella dulcis TaxID=2967339 RepID=A0ABT3WGP5_9PROT|nr:autotransporter domain-containing protein [Bombella dulcis]MCX5616046.1 autotransporter domain-containing protein [Bombella dulcis]